MNNAYCTWRPQDIYDHSSLRSSYKWKYFTRYCAAGQNAHFMFNNFFPWKWCRSWDNVEKYCHVKYSRSATERNWDVTETFLSVWTSPFNYTWENFTERWRSATERKREVWCESALRRGSASPRLLELRVRIPPEAWNMYVVCCTGRGLCSGPVSRPQEPCRRCTCNWRWAVCWLLIARCLIKCGDHLTSLPLP